jgi:hypothetical protein
LIGLIDANWVGDSTDRCSCNGFVFILTGGAISWGSQKQKCVTLSSTESEFLIYLILLATLGPGVYSASNRNEYRKHKKKILGIKVRLVHGADNHTAIYEPIV